MRRSTLMDDHNERVRALCSRVQSFHERKAHFRIYHGTTSTTRSTKRSRDRVVDTSGLDNVLEVDVSRRTAIVEPNVSMEQLVNACLKYDLIPTVVMEFPTITVGGGYAGTSGESSSFRYGFFEKTISRVEIILADGEVIEASRSEREDLLNAAGGSFGTFGVITSLDIDLIPAKPYVKLTYKPTTRLYTAGSKHLLKYWVNGVPHSLQSQPPGSHDRAVSERSPKHGSFGNGDATFKTGAKRQDEIVWYVRGPYAAHFFHGNVRGVGIAKSPVL
ncbi:hypothetical protein LTR86_010394 [Recurvomyces mirabilis]|nr:hypothetical protein LTR86_010394 [Recurvomyces mirabilis]